MKLKGKVWLWLTLFIIASVLLFTGCSPKVEYRTKLIYPTFSHCPKPARPTMIDYRESEDIASPYNFNAWMKNQINSHNYAVNLENAYDCMNAQIVEVVKRQEAEGAKR